MTHTPPRMSPPPDAPPVRRRFLTDRSATTAIEFGALLFPFLGLLGATLDAGMIYYRSAQLQNTTLQASRMLLTGTLTDGLTYDDFINKYVCTWQKKGSVDPGTLSIMFDCSRIIVDIQSPTRWSDTDIDESFTIAKGKSVIEHPAPGDVAVLRIVYPVDTFFRFLRGKSNGLKKEYSDQLMGMVAVRVEP